jgi:hypothetical protein
MPCPTPNFFFLFAQVFSASTHANKSQGRSSRLRECETALAWCSTLYAVGGDGMMGKAKKKLFKPSTIAVDRANF